MLNEIYGLGRGLSAAGIEVAPRHADVSSPGRTEALHVRLDANGSPAEVTALGPDRVSVLWTLRNGKHNSFPYVQMKRPLLIVPDDDTWRKVHGDAWKSMAPSGRRQCLRDLARDYKVAPDACAPLVSKGLHKSLKERRSALAVLEEPHASVPASVERALMIRDGAEFAKALQGLILAELDQGDDAFLKMAHVVLIGRVVQGKVTGCPLLFDVLSGEFRRDVADCCHAAVVSRALSGGRARNDLGLCLLSGTETPLHTGNFPQPTVPVLGQIYLFSKNSDIPAAYRYGRADADGLPIGSELPQTLAGALDALTAPEFKNRTWRDVPGEKPETYDLLIAFVDGVPDARVAAIVAGEGAGESGDDPFAEETGHLDEDERRAITVGTARSIFLTRAERVIEAIKGKAGLDFRDTPVSVLVLRKVDTGNAKAILHRILTVGGLYEAATAWAEALNNSPPWLRMPVPRKGRLSSRPAPAFAPLQLPQATRTLFIRSGTERAKREPVGVTAPDALALFLGEAGAERIAQAALKAVLARQGVLLAGTAQALRRDRAKEGSKAAHPFDRTAASQAVAVLSLLLAKTGRNKEAYMGSAAFQLGQVLAAADVIHAGYCAAVRGGQTPPTLLGNSLLAIAQDDPARALALLGRRWGPYLAWVRAQADWDEADRLTKSGKPGDEAKGWAIKSALADASRVKGVAEVLGGNVPDSASTDDKFRAELLLGYVAGLPKPERKAGMDKEANGS